jgi:hypothetical protein
MKKFLKSFVQHIGDLILKVLEFKVLAACVITAIYLGKAETFGLGGFLAVSVIWLATVGIRYAEKVKGLLPLPGALGVAGGVASSSVPSSAPKALASEASHSAEAKGD